MLNLTEHDIALIAESGETTTIPVSGYVARVEYERREAACQQYEDSYGPHAPTRLTKEGVRCENCYASAVDDGDINRNGWNLCAPIIEQTPREIVVEVRLPGSLEGRTMPLEQIIRNTWARGEDAPRLFFVTREVAEAAAMINHPLAARMLWASDPCYAYVDPCDTCDANRNKLFGYRELRRVGGVM